MSDLLKGIMSNISPSLVQSVAGKLGESESGITKALGGMVPTLLAGMIGKSSNSSAMSGLFSMLTDSKSSGMLDNIGNLVSSGSFMQAAGSNDLAAGFLKNILGDKSSSIMSALSSFSGLKGSSTSSLMSLAAPLVMGFLSKKISGGGLNIGSFIKMLSGEKSSIMAALPPGMGSSLGLASGMDTPSAPKAGSKLPLIVGLIVAALAAFWGWKSCNKPPVEVPKVEIPKVNTDSIAQAAIDAANAAKTTVKGWFHKLDNGYELTGDSTGIERNLLEFIVSNKEVDKTTWFNFDHLVFQTGSAQLDMDQSKNQLNNIAEILKAYPKVNLKIGGYTDNTGNANLNMKLSQERADAVKKALTDMGVDPKRMAAEGYGDQHPVAGNDTEEGRAQNRRIAVRVSAK